MRLSELKTGEAATIVKVTGHGGFRRRIMEMGFVRGQRVEVILNAPLKDPIEYKVMGYDISLRRSEADMVIVLSDSEASRYVSRMEEDGVGYTITGEGDKAVDAFVLARAAAKLAKRFDEADRIRDELRRQAGVLALAQHHGPQSLDERGGLYAAGAALHTGKAGEALPERFGLHERLDLIVQHIRYELVRLDVHLVERRAGSGAFAALHALVRVDAADLADLFRLFLCVVHFVAASSLTPSASARSSVK